MRARLQGAPVIAPSPIPPAARLLPALLAERDWLQAALAAAQLVVLVAAASGLLAGSG